MTNPFLYTSKQKLLFKKSILRVLIVLFYFCLHTVSLFGDDISVEHVCSDQKLDLRINGGIQPYEVLWQGFNGGNYSDIPGWPKSNLDGQDGQEDLVGALHFTKYKVIVTDELCGTAVYEIEVDPCKCLKVNLEWKQNVSECSYPEFQTNSGALTISVTGTNDYNVRWSNGSTNTSINKLITGQYTVTVTSGACRIVRTYQICCCGTAGGMQPPNSPPVILCPESGDLEITNENVNSPTNATSFDGSISISVNGASSITWYGPNGPIGYGNSISGLGPGEYCAQIFDGCGNAIDKCYELVDCSTNPITINGTVTNTCSGYSEGSITITVTGGNSGYTYNWNNGSTSSNLINLAQGQYCVNVKDSRGCKASRCFTVGLNNLISSECFVLCNGIPVENYYPIVNVQHPTICKRSIAICSGNPSIVLGSFEDWHLEENFCVLSEVNSSSRQICASYSGQSCRRCIFAGNGDGGFANCTVNYCLYPQLNLMTLSNIRDFNNIAVRNSVVGENSLCSYQLYDNCVDPNSPIWQQNMDCRSQHPFYQFSCNSFLATGTLYQLTWPCLQFPFNVNSHELSQSIKYQPDQINLRNDEKLSEIEKKYEIEKLPLNFEFDLSNIFKRKSAYTNFDKNACKLDVVFESPIESQGKIILFSKNYNKNAVILNSNFTEGLNLITIEQNLFSNYQDFVNILVEINDTILLYDELKIQKCDISFNANDLIQVFPNPANDNVKISISNNIKPQGTILLSSMDQNILKTIDINNQKEISINTSDLPAGIYTITTFFSSGHTSITKFIKIN